jgi:hypothetical protein
MPDSRESFESKGHHIFTRDSLVKQIEQRAPPQNQAVIASERVYRYRSLNTS